MSDDYQAGEAVYDRAPGGGPDAAPRLRLPLLPGRMTAYLYRLRTEGGSAVQQAAAIGLGLFIGCLPSFGLHFWLCIGAGWLLGLNRLKMYLAANISNPFFAPVLIFAEVQSGRWLRTGTVYSMSPSAFGALDPLTFVGDLALGSVVLGGALGVLAALATFIVVRRAGLDARDEAVVREAAGRFLAAGIPAWEVANGKLRRDPVYREVLRRIPLPAAGRVLDLGCGRGLMLAMLAAARHGGPDGVRTVDRLILHGIECRPRMVRLARRALGADAIVEEGDLTSCPLPAANLVFLFDVLHLLPPRCQEELVDRLRAGIPPGGQLLVREGDAGGRWGFVALQAGNRLVAILQGRWRRRFHFRSGGEWVRILGAHGFEAQVVPMGQGTPYANILIQATRRSE